MSTIPRSGVAADADPDPADPRSHKPIEIRSLRPRPAPRTGEVAKIRSASDAGTSPTLDASPGTSGATAA